MVTETFRLRIIINRCMTDGASKAPPSASCKTLAPIAVDTRTISNFIFRSTGLRTNYKKQTCVGRINPHSPLFADSSSCVCFLWRPLFNSVFSSSLLNYFRLVKRQVFRFQKNNLRRTSGFNFRFQKLFRLDERQILCFKVIWV